MKEAARLFAKMGGLARKKKADYSAMGKKGMEKRWGKKKEKETL